MKLLAVVLGLSLAANAALLLAPCPAPAPSAPPVVAPKAAATPKRITFCDTTWQRAMAGDDAALKAIGQSGLPPELARALMAAAISERFRARERELFDRPEKGMYWSTAFSRNLYTPKDRLAQLDLRREKEAALDEWVPGWRETNPQITSVSALVGSEKAARLKMIEDDYRALTQNVRGDWTMYNVPLPSDREKLRYLETERRKEIADLLTPEEMKQYDLRMSNTASSLRFTLDLFGPTEEEFRRIFEIQQGVEQALGPMSYGIISNEESQARKKQQDAADLQLKNLLGEQRYADYLRAKDYEFRGLSELTAKLDLPSSRAVEAYTLQKSLETRLNEASAKKDKGERSAAFLALKQEADREFTRLLGDKGYATLQQYGTFARRLQMMTSAQAGGK